MYEAGPEITTVGAGISVWPRTWDVMRWLVMYDDLAREAVKAGSGSENGELSVYLHGSECAPRNLTICVRRNGVCVPKVGLAA